MSHHSDPRVDAYIAKSAEFAKPILEHLRKVVHEACPEAEEAMKWNFPYFLYKKEMICGMAAFKTHAGFGFWKWKLISGDKEDAALGIFKRITQLSGLPPDAVLKKYIQKAMALSEAEVKTPRPEKKERAELIVPAILTEALKENDAARKTFEGFSYSKKKEYVEWLAEAKTEATRQKRLAQTREWLAEGKSRNWKYQNY